MLGWDVNDRMVGCDDSDVTARFKGLAWTRQPLAILFRFESSRKDWKKQQASFQRLGKIWTTTEPRQLKLDERRQLSNEGPDLASSLSAVYLKDLFEFSIKAIIHLNKIAQLTMDEGFDLTNSNTVVNCSANSGNSTEQ